MMLSEKAALDTRIRCARRMAKRLAREGDVLRLDQRADDASGRYLRAARLEEIALRTVEHLGRSGWDYGPSSVVLARSVGCLYWLAGAKQDERRIVEEYGERAFFHRTYDTI